jgi:hypothetical protein
MNYFKNLWLKLIFTMILWNVVAIEISAQTVLSAGDIVFTGWNSNDPTVNGGGTVANDDISFVLLRDITTNTTIYFTDLGWITSNLQKRPDNGCSASQGDLSSGIVQWTATSAMSAGTQVLVRCKFSPTTTSTAGTCTVTALLATYNSAAQYMSLGNTGEQFFAVQGTYNSGTKLFTSITMIAGVNYQTSTWSTTLNECDLSPTQSRNPGTSGIFTISGTTPWVNAMYNGTMSGSASTIRTNVLNPANWTFSTSTSHAGYTLPLSSSFALGNTWTGSTSTAWNTASNWSTGLVPVSTEDVIIPTVTNNPIVSTGTANCNNITINSGGNLTVTGGTLQIAGSINNSGTFTASAGGTIALTGSSAQTIPANTFAANTIANLTLNNSSGATLAGTLNITGTYTPTAGTLTTGGYLVLKSTSGSTGRIASGNTSGGYISGNVTVERYISGRRAYRFLAHPFTTSQPLSILTDDIDITGSGGSANGFTTTGSNNPSAFWYDATTANGSSTNDIGWTAYTSASTSSWDQYEALRVLVRGAIGEGLTGAAYTPSAVTLDMSGAVNQGTQTISRTKGSGTTYALVGNPFPSPVNMDALGFTGGIGSNFYVWNAQQGTKGGYTTYSYGSSSFNLPIGGSFVTQILSNGSIIIEEADKTASTSTMFKTTGFSNRVTLNIEDSTTYWDRLQLHYDDNAMAVVEIGDALKFPNPEVTFNTISKDDSALAIDSRPYTENETIELGFTTPYQKNYKISVPDINMPPGTKLFLKDNYTGKSEELFSGYEYWFTVDANTSSQGKGRFELNASGKPTLVAGIRKNELKVKLAPNPVADNVTIYYESATSAPQIMIYNMVGMKVADVKAIETNGKVLIPLEHIATGIYNVTVRDGNQVFTQKLIKK